MFFEQEARKNVWRDVDSLPHDGNGVDLEVQKGTIVSACYPGFRLSSERMEKGKKRNKGRRKAGRGNTETHRGKMEYHMAKLLRPLQPIVPLLLPFVFFVQRRVVLVSRSSTPLFTWVGFVPCIYRMTWVAFFILNSTSCRWQRRILEGRRLRTSYMEIESCRSLGKYVNRFDSANSIGSETELNIWSGSLYMRRHKRSDLDSGTVLWGFRFRI